MVKKKKRGLLRRILPQSLTFQAVPPSVSVSFELRKKTSRRRKPAKAIRVIAQKEVPTTPLNPIQADMLPKIQAAKKQAELQGQGGNVIFLSAIEFALKDPKGFKKFWRDLGKIFD